jgi:membrane protease subunit HflK
VNHEKSKLDDVWSTVWQKIETKPGGWGNKSGSWLLALVTILVVVWLASGVYTVGPGEVGVIRQFGKFVAQTEPGLNYRLPWPVQSVDVVNVAGIRRAEIGFRTAEVPGRATELRRVPEESMMLTRDKNIADVQVLILYQVKDAPVYLFGSKEPERFLRVNTEIALRSAVGGFEIDYIMTVGRPEVESATWNFLQRLMDDHHTGLHIVGVELQAVDPPEEVKETFYEVVRAKADEERLKREAEGYALDVVPRARGEATRIIQAATAYKEQRILIAEGESSRFLAMAKEYRQAPEVTKRRLYFETIEAVLARTENIIVNPRAGGGVAPLLPLRDFGLGAN